MLDTGDTKNEKHYLTPLREAREVVLLAFKQCLSTCPTGGHWVPQAPGTSTHGFFSGLGTCPSYPICGCGFLLFCLTLLFCFYGRWCNYGSPLTCCELCPPVFRHPSLMLTYCCPALTCGDPVDSPMAPETVSKRGKVCIPSLCPLLPVCPPRESVKGDARCSPNLVSLSSSWAFRKTKIDNS